MKTLMKTRWIGLILAVGAAVGCARALGAAEPEPDFKSKVPQFKFADTRVEQEVQLKANPLLARFAESRKKMATDTYRPIYHFISPESTMNDPNGLCFWQGRWHLFYQAYPPEDRRQHSPRGDHQPV